MKSKPFSFIAVSMMLIVGLTSCSDNANDAIEPDQEEKSLADYTVIMWMDGGGIMDPCNLADLNNMVLMREDGRIGKNVNVVGSYSVSPMYQAALKEKGIAPVFTFELGEKTGLGSDTIAILNKVTTFLTADSILNLPEKENVDSTANMYDMAVHCLKNYADNTSTDMNKSASLAAFIRKAAAEHPAKNYVVYFVAHGDGYNPTVSEEDYNGTNVRSNVIHTAGIAKAIKDSGVKVQTIVFNCCLMATLENFCILDGCTDYVMASCETTLSGYMSQFVEGLSVAGDDVEKMKAEARKVVDYYQKISESFGDTSHGFYDMSYNNELMASVKRAAQWFANANTTNETFMQDVVESTIYCCSKPPVAGDEEVTAFYQSRMAVREILFTDPEEVDVDEFTTNLITILSYMAENISNYYCFSDMQQSALEMKDTDEAKGLDFNALQDIYDQYMATLHKMAYIKCTGAQTEDEGYLYTSPSVNLFTMNEKSYFKPKCVGLYLPGDGFVVDEKAVSDFVKKVINADTPEESYNLMYQYFGGTWYAHFAKLETVESRYTSTEFDKKTGWSEVLKTLPSNPIYMINPLRAEKSGILEECIYIP